MSSGAVKWFNPAKGCGFIQPSDGSKDVGLREDQNLTFDVERGQQGRLRRSIPGSPSG